MTLEVLCATMNQTDNRLFEEMNIQSNVLYANQCEKNEYSEEIINGHIVKRISSTTKGVGLNRNIALAYATGDILLFADDDMCYYDDYEKEIVNAFRLIPDADIIAFGIRYTRDGQVYKTCQEKRKRRYRYNGMHYGTCRLAIRRSSYLKCQIRFSQVFGGGCVYCAGEDSLFLCDAYNAGLKVYSYDYIVGENKKDSSTWFRGFDEKFYYDDGAYMEAGFGIIKYVYALKHAFDNKNYGITKSQKYKAILTGMKGYRQLLSYEDWKKRENHDNAKKKQ